MIFFSFEELTVSDSSYKRKLLVSLYSTCGLFFLNLLMEGNVFSIHVAHYHFCCCVWRGCLKKKSKFISTEEDLWVSLTL